MNKHTPGPWSVEKNGEEHHAMVVFNGNYSIGRVSGYVQETVEANARLIAAAPELLHALQDLVRVVSHIQDTPLADPLKYVPRSAYTSAYQRALRAIKTATGS